MDWYLAIVAIYCILNAALHVRDEIVMATLYMIMCMWSVVFFVQ